MIATAGAGGGSNLQGHESRMIATAGAGGGSNLQGHESRMIATPGALNTDSLRNEMLFSDTGIDRRRLRIGVAEHTFGTLAGHVALGWRR